MYHYYRPYPYYRRYYHYNPYYYYRRYYPYYNVVDSQIADVDQSIYNYGDMTDVIQDADVYQSMAPAPKEKEESEIETEIAEIVSEQSEEDNTPPPSPFISLQ